jgi:hypothetical protein
MRIAAMRDVRAAGGEVGWFPGAGAPVRLPASSVARAR